MDIQQQPKTILIDFKDSYLEISLNRPEVHNAMNREMIGELTAIFRSLKVAKKNPLVVVIRGEGKSFCAGADLNYMKEIAGNGFKENVNDGKKLADLFLSIYHCPVPTIAMVHGVAFGGANGLLSACDIVLASSETKFAFSEVKLGISPATIAPFVMNRIGETGAKTLMLTGKRFDAAEALRWNLVNEVVSENMLHEKLSEWVAHFHSAAPNAVRETKILIEKLSSETEDNVYKYTSELIARLRASEEGQEGMAAFLEKRKPFWNK
ncbi:MAG: enoyl-CoA hydratase/isomerase family protein [Bacteroidales bacterium]|nr:enoyl-CoA hydratase/isomerase family protein [Bacteroidales bacterium]